MYVLYKYDSHTQKWSPKIHMLAAVYHPLAIQYRLSFIKLQLHAQYTGLHIKYFHECYNLLAFKRVFL